MHVNKVLDLCGAVFALISTSLFVKISVFAWIVSLLALAINAVLFFKLGIYGAFTLQIIFSVLSVYGLMNWLTNKDQETKVKIRSLPKKYYFPIITILVISSTFLSLLLNNLFNTRGSILDGSTAAMSIVAQWMTANRFLECWVLWFIIDFLSVFLYYTKGAYFHTLLFFIYCFVAVFGYYQWKKAMPMPSSMAKLAYNT